MVLCVLHVALFLCVVCECLFLFESVCVCYTPANKSVVVCPFSIASKNGRQRNRRRYIGLYLPLFVLCAGLFASHWRVSMETERVKKENQIKTWSSKERERETIPSNQNWPLKSGKDKVK